MRGSGEKILDCVGVFLASYDVAVVTFFVFANYFQLYRMGLVYCFIWCYMLFISLCVELWKRTNLGLSFLRTDKNDVKKGLSSQIMADFSPQVCVCVCVKGGVVRAYVSTSHSHFLFLCFVSVLKLSHLFFLSLGAKLYFIVLFILQRLGRHL